MTLVGSAEIVGVYAVAGDRVCHLLEMIIRDVAAAPDFGSITQAVGGLDRSNWQVPYDEKLLDATGERVVADLFADGRVAWPSVARVAFFFHELQFDMPLLTPWGGVPIPAVGEWPSRLAFLAYDRP